MATEEDKRKYGDELGATVAPGANTPPSSAQQSAPGKQGTGWPEGVRAMDVAPGAPTKGAAVEPIGARALGGAPSATVRPETAQAVADYAEGVTDDEESMRRVAQILERTKPAEKTPEQKAKEARSYRARMALLGLTHVAGGLANLFATNQYATNQKQDDSDLDDAQKRYYAILDARRKGQADWERMRSETLARHQAALEQNRAKEAAAAKAYAQQDAMLNKRINAAKDAAQAKQDFDAEQLDKKLKADKEKEDRRAAMQLKLKQLGAASRKSSGTGGRSSSRSVENFIDNDGTNYGIDSKDFNDNYGVWLQVMEEDGLKMPEQKTKVTAGDVKDFVKRNWSRSKTLKGYLSDNYRTSKGSPAAKASTGAAPAAKPEGAKPRLFGADDKKKEKGKNNKPRLF